MQQEGRALARHHLFGLGFLGTIALPDLLVQLKAGGYKVVQVKAKSQVTTLADYDAEAQKLFSGGAASQAQLSSVVRTVGESNFDERFSLAR